MYKTIYYSPGGNIQKLELHSKYLFRRLQQWASLGVLDVVTHELNLIQLRWSLSKIFITMQPYLILIEVIVQQNIYHYATYLMLFTLNHQNRCIKWQISREHYNVPSNWRAGVALAGLKFPARTSSLEIFCINHPRRYKSLIYFLAENSRMPRWNASIPISKKTKTVPRQKKIRSPRCHSRKVISKKTNKKNSHSLRGYALARNLFRDYLLARKMGICLCRNFRDYLLARKMGICLCQKIYAFAPGIRPRQKFLSGLPPRQKNGDMPLPS